jgi:hypothetical protein
MIELSPNTRPNAYDKDKNSFAIMSGLLVTENEGKSEGVLGINNLI